jgi:hypothetical protein
MNQNKAEPIAISPIAWVACGISILLVFLLCCVTLYVTERWRRSMAFELLAESIDSSDYTGASENLERLTEAPQAVNWIYGFSGSPVTLGTLQKEQAGKVLDVMIALSRTETTETESAIRLYDTSIAPWLTPAAFSSRPDLIGIPVELNKIFAELRTQLDSREAAYLESETLETRWKALLSQYRLISGDFAELLGLPQPTGDSMEFYNSGVFRDFPVLQNLPDGIIDLGQLKDLLSRIGGEVKIAGQANPQQYFAAQIARIRDASAPMVAQKNELEAKRTAILEGLADREKEITSRRKEGVSKLKVILSWLSKP